MALKSIDTRIARIEASQLPASSARVGRVIAELGETTDEARDRFRRVHPDEQFGLVIVRTIVAPPWPGRS